ncbi:MAG: hypothetical protein IIT39_10680, partial [Clostridia bacterium]|nr:hypothetical protein [Clostridia bacterium]
DAASNYGYRCDGRWYYSKIGQKINANVEIQIVSTDENGNVTIVTPKDDFKTNTVHTGNITNANAYFTNSGFSGEVESGKISEDGSKNFTLTADSSSVAVNGDTYVFRGWYLRVGDYDYTPLNSSNNLYSTTATSPMSSSGTFVARYEKIESKTLVISHQLYSTAEIGSLDPVVYGGTGKTYVSVTIYDEDNKYVTEYQETEGSRTISNAAHLQSGYKIVVTLRTEPDTGSTMENMYHKNDTYNTPATGYKDITNSDDETTQTITYYVNDLFPEGVTARTIKEYSNLSTSNITVYFKYYDRKTDGQSIPMTVDEEPTTITVNTVLSSTGTGNAEKLDNTVLDAYNAKVNGKVGTALDEYFFRTNQITAVNDFGNKVDLHATYANFDPNVPGKEYTEVSYNDNIDAENENTIKYDLNKHFDYFGNACMKKAYKSESNYAFQESYNDDSKSVDDWVTYRDSNNQVITFDEAEANPKRVASITVWGYNTPKTYHLNFTAADSNTGFSTTADFTNSSSQEIYIPATN